jgi:hypothetical protein
LLLESRCITLDNDQKHTTDLKIYHAIEPIVRGLVRAIRVVLEEKLDKVSQLDLEDVTFDDRIRWNQCGYRDALMMLLKEGEIDLTFAEDHHLFESCIYQAISRRLIQRLFFVD